MHISRSGRPKTASLSYAVTVNPFFPFFPHSQLGIYNEKCSSTPPSGSTTRRTHLSLSHEPIGIYTSNLLASHIYIISHTQVQCRSSQQYSPAPMLSLSLSMLLSRDQYQFPYVPDTVCNIPTKKKRPQIDPLCCPHPHNIRDDAAEFSSSWGYR
ncbi:uncharacterized protein EI90DRAFT_223739 [Cantharellus anzutake]|uniref:uncharacterized protein n=1 Tax=Cantharellus anzutake TaxID=1750568 RepID=UPI001904DB5B|nr:uncharacterized protein EI90DRAFT_223739 [Cantharellus anzutake]KAF8316698.1 hypothetical protein EI90DRAFT_223739 [Cantharellus anzutake]